MQNQLQQKDTQIKHIQLQLQVKDAEINRLRGAESKEPY